MALFNSILTNNVNNNAQSTVTNNASSAVKEVDVIGMMSALKKNGEARLSDYAKPVVAAPAPAPKPAQVAAPAQTAAPAPEPKKAKGKKSKTNEPELTAQIAHRNIEESIKGGSIKMVKSGSDYRFSNATDANRLFSLRKSFRKLGGEFDAKTTEWFVPVKYYDNPQTAVETKSEKRIQYEQFLKEQAAKLAEPAPTADGTLTVQEARKLAIKMAREINEQVSEKILKMVADKYFA